MESDLTAVKAALSELGDRELRALIATTYGVPQIARVCWRGSTRRATGN
jgi:hypothetical protein